MTSAARNEVAARAKGTASARHAFNYLEFIWIKSFRQADGTCEAVGEGGSFGVVETLDHHIRRFDQSCDGVALLES